MAPMAAAKVGTAASTRAVSAVRVVAAEAAAAVLEAAAKAKVVGEEDPEAMDTEAASLVDSRAAREESVAVGLGSPRS